MRQDKQSCDNWTLDQFEQDLCVGKVQAWVQPQVVYDTKHVVGGELLCRWEPQPGVLVPAEHVVQMLVSHDRLYELARFMIEQACILQSCRTSGYLSVNLSQADLEDPRLAADLAVCLTRYGISAEEIHLEITESVFASDQMRVWDCIRRLRQAGFLLELDDFGSGMSSLEMLSELPVSCLKLSPRFVSRIDSDRQRKVIQCILDLASELNMQVIAEGVETPRQAAVLRGMGCQVMQGYLFSPAVRPADFLQHQDGCLA